MGIEISETTRVLRELLLHGETLQSHILHVCYLAIPDLLKVNSVIPLIETHKDVILMVTRLHRLANHLCDVIGGRTTHPIRARIGRFSKLPTKKELEELHSRFVDALRDLKKLSDVMKSLSPNIPDFTRETEYLSLTDSREYAFYQGQCTSTDIDGTVPIDEYKGIVNEFVVPQSTAKYGKFNRDSLMVGALARYNNNHNYQSSVSFLASSSSITGISSLIGNASLSALQTSSLSSLW